MQKLILVFLIALSSGSVFAQKKVFCDKKDILITTTKAKAHSDYDKNMHCSTSCMLTLRCSSKHVLAIGYLKEFRDIFAKGNPDINDIMANRTGISIAVHKRAIDDKECMEQCDQHYVPRKPTR